MNSDYKVEMELMKGLNNKTNRFPAPLGQNTMYCPMCKYEKMVWDRNVGCYFCTTCNYAQRKHPKQLKKLWR